MDHLIFDGGGGGYANPPQNINIEHMLLVKKKIYLTEFLRRRKVSGTLSRAWQSILHDA